MGNASEHFSYIISMQLKDITTRLHTLEETQAQIQTRCDRSEEQAEALIKLSDYKIKQNEFEDRILKKTS